MQFIIALNGNVNQKSNIFGYIYIHTHIQKKKKKIITTRNPMSLKTFKLIQVECANLMNIHINL